MNACIHSCKYTKYKGINHIILIHIQNSHQQQPDYAGKITGMLLEMENNDLLHLLDDKEALEGKINEAMEVLKQHFGESTESA